MNIRAIARVAVLVLSLATISIGIWLVATRSLAVSTLTAADPDTYEITNVDVLGTGNTLLGVGLLILAATLIAEGHRRS